MDYSDYSLYWGDIHNHNALGYARGSLERSIDIAREHLDFFAFTGHSQWPDMPTMPGERHMKWVNGFEALRQNWPNVRQLTSEANAPGEFVTILGYEFHSSEWGDYCLYYPGDDGELYCADTLADLQAHARTHGCLLIPHHLAYPLGWRGINWDTFDPSLAPVVEIYSEHGGSERDRGLFPMIRHSCGGRTTDGTAQAALARGLRVGFIASTDDHLGYPGAYGEGIAAVYAEKLSREAILAAIWHRRTYAVTGDRIRVELSLNGEVMGSEVAASGTRHIEARVEGWDEIDSVEVVKNGRVMARGFADPPPATQWPERMKCRIEWGWGPWADLAMERIVDWEMSLEVDGAELLAMMPCFQSGPFEPERRNEVLEMTPTRCRWRSYTSRQQAFAEQATNALVFEIAGSPDARLELRITQPAERAISRTLGQLMERSAAEFTGGFTSESVLVHRLVPMELYETSLALDDEPSGDGGTDYYYLRVRQANGHMAWSSPIWAVGSGQ